MKFAAVAALALALALGVVPALAQPPLDGNSLTWLAGSRVHTNANGSKVYEAFIGPLDGVVTGTALFPGGVEYHKLGPGPDGKTFGLSVANTRSNLAWNFTPLKAFEKDRVIFETPDGNVRVQYYLKPGNVIGAKVERKAADGKVVTTEYAFAPLP